MLRVYHILIGLILLILTPIVFKFFHPNSPTQKLQTNPIRQPHPVATLTQINSASKPTEGNIWKSVLGKTATPPGWKVAPCEGNAPLLCISSQGKVLGTVEMQIYPLANQPNFQKMLVAAGIPPGAKVDLQSPNYQTQVLTALSSWVADHYTVLSKDLKSADGVSISFSPQSPQQVPFGMLHGMRYSFTGIQQGGKLYQQNLGYVAFDGASLYVIQTAFDPAAKTGKFEKSENLEPFESYLSAIVADLRLPK
ncbi:hypothetical protein OGM63_29185 [Plectonema radiosum NIES-515]|uniref:Serine/threonine protein kinase n=1 Tax=Plectonema radiosum NIES-515 TaxID=2986073 RepID=A0ABT3B843_9CYAN|nr:hypothetical protein [Plectonema radiosum]MCV3217536.1 hypothetical protein [Plectonema radiosum NIES-515]